MSRKIFYLDCVSGIAGDMTVAALLDLGGDPELLRRELAKLKLQDVYELEVRSVDRAGITATKFDVRLVTEQGEPHHSHEHTHAHPHSHSHEHPHVHHDHGGEADHGLHGHHHRSYREIAELIRDAGLNESVTSLALKMFDMLAAAESTIHGVAKDEVHFHEVGAIDSIIDIVGTAILVNAIGADLVMASPVPVGHGSVRTMHGDYPIPAPATLEILKGKPIRYTDLEAELTTPTGALIISSLCSEFGPLPSMEVGAIGYGAGSADFAGRPNVLRAVLGTQPSAPSSSPGMSHSREHIDNEMICVEVNLDNMAGDMLGYVMEQLFDAGANDVFYTPIYMKKNRPAVTLQVLCRLDQLETIKRILFNETTTLGLRYYPVTVHRLGREYVPVETPWGSVRVKQGIHASRVVQQTPEYEDCRKLADAHGVPLHRIYRAVWESLPGAAAETPGGDTSQASG